MKAAYCVLLFLLAAFLQGCVAIPPLIQVEHKDTANSDIRRRLDSIDRRLDRLEEKSQSTQANK